jgi:hypothetical protein
MTTSHLSSILVFSKYFLTACLCPICGHNMVFFSHFSEVWGP